MTPVLVESEEQMLALGGKVASQASAGMAIRLIGPLGAGKTTFARGLIRELGFSGEVRSPTFNLIHEYPTLPPVCHVDLYRLQSLKEVADLGLQDYLWEHLLLVEWAERAAGLFPDDTPTIRFAIAGDSRLVEFEGLSL